MVTFSFKVLLVWGGFATMILLVACDPNGSLAWPTAAPSQGLLNAFSGHTLWVSGVSWSPDGKYIASSSGDGTVRIWDTEGREVQILKIESGSATSVDWSPDGKYLVAGLARPSDTVQIWETSGWKIANKMNPKGFINSTEWSPDGQYIAVGKGFVDSNPNSGKLESGIDVYDAATAELRASLIYSYTHDVYSVSWSPDSKWITFRSNNASSSPESERIGGQAGIWDLTTSLARGLDEVATRGDVTWLDQTQVDDIWWSPDGKYIAVGGAHGLELWDPVTHKQVSTLVTFGDPVSTIAWSPDGKYIAFAGPPPGIQVWDIAQNKLLDENFSGWDTINSMDWSPDSKYLVTGSEDHYVRTWDALMALRKISPSSSTPTSNP